MSRPRNLPPNAVRRDPNSTRQQQQQTQQPPWRSSLELVWSYSRSQAFYAGNLGSSPSFTDSRWQGASYDTGIESSDNIDEDDYEDDDDDDDEEDDDGSASQDEQWDAQRRRRVDSEDGLLQPPEVFPHSAPWSDESGEAGETRIGTSSPQPDLRRPTDRRISRLASGDDRSGERSRSRDRSPKDLGYGKHAEAALPRRPSNLNQQPTSNEATALLPSRNKAYNSTGTEEQQRRFSRSSASKRRPSGVSLGSRRIRRRPSQPQHQHPRGTSTFKQTLFNCINALVGVGILSLPLALSYSSLTIGIPLFLGAGLLTSYTGKLLWKVMLLDPRLRTYADIGRYAFGDKAQVIIAMLFGAELWAVSVALIVLFGDSVYALVHSQTSPQVITTLAGFTGLDTWAPTAFKILGFVLVLPTVFMPLRLLAPISVAGIMSTVAILVILITEGCLKPEKPGSLRQPAISVWPPEPPQWTKLPLCFGLIMSGFAAHPVIPALVRDMKDPHRFPAMLNLSYVIATCVYLTMGIAGYLMFGSTVTDEITRNLTHVKEYPLWLTKLAIWLIVVVPLTKFALASRPVMGIIEGVFGVEEQVPVVEVGKAASASGGSGVASSNAGSGAESAYSIRGSSDVQQGPAGPESRRRYITRQAIRLFLTIGILLTAILLPEFERLMAFLGAALACTTCVIGPVAAHLKVFGREMSRLRIAGEIGILAIVATLGVLGTVWAFTPLAKR